MFSHYLITRFNILISEHGPERMNFPQVDELWLDNRIALFLRYCVPSVLNQKNKNFTWLIYFDQHTPAHALEKINELKANEQKIEFVFVEDFNHMLNDMRIRFRNSEKPFIISSRLDNDDAIGDQFIQCLQDAFVPESNCMLNINSGYVYDVKKKVLTLWNNKFTNQFSSIIESTHSGDFITIYGFPHWRPPALSRTIHILNQPGWVEIIHPVNNRQRASMGIPVLSITSLRTLPKSIAASGISIWNTLQYMVGWIPSIVRRRILIFFRGGIK